MSKIPERRMRRRRRREQPREEVTLTLEQRRIISHAVALYANPRERGTNSRNARKLLRATKELRLEESKDRITELQEDHEALIVDWKKEVDEWERRRANAGTAYDVKRPKFPALDLDVEEEAFSIRCTVFDWIQEVLEKLEDGLTGKPEVIVRTLDAFNCEIDEDFADDDEEEEEKEEPESEDDEEIEEKHETEEVEVAKE